MKRRIFINILLGVFLYGVFGFILISTFTANATYNSIAEFIYRDNPQQNIAALFDSLLNMSYVTWGILFLAGLLLFILLAVFVYRPLYQIAKGAKNYASGHYNKKIPVREADNELGYITASLNYMANQLDTMEDAQRKFISNVSHDFRSPLTSIRGYVEAIQDGTIPPENQGKYLDIILFETERLTQLTEGLLELNKYGKSASLDLTDFDICEVIHHTLATCKGAYREKHISFETQLPNHPLIVEADIGKIQQVLYNLIDNAMKFSHANSTIIITCRSKGGKAYISVKDTGIGIPQDEISHIWDRFYKSDSSRGKDKRGTGLGLAIVKEIIQAHDEKINVISTKDVGSEFIFTLTLKQSK